MFRKATTLKTKLIGVTVVAVAGLAIYLAVIAINGVPLYPYHYVTADFANAGDLSTHNDVRIAGARVGQVISLKKGPDGTTQVKLQLQPQYRLYRDASATVGAISVLGEEYVSLNPGSPATGRLAGAAIPLSHTQPPVEIDQILNILGPKQQQSTAALLQTLGAGFGGQGQNLNTLLDSAPTLLPDVGTTTSALAASPTQLVPFMQATNQLARAFVGRTGQLSALVGQMSQTFSDLATQQGKPLQAAIADAAPALPQLTPALQSLASAAATTESAVAQLRPGLAALGAATPPLRSLLVQGVTPLGKVPPVAGQAVPGLEGVSGLLSTAEQKVIPLVTGLEAGANPLVTYLAPYTGQMTSLWNNLNSALGTQGDINGTWLRLAVTLGPREVTGSSPLTQCRNPYPAPGQTAGDASTPLVGGCK